MWWPQVPVNFGEIGLVHWMKAFSSEEQSHGSLMTKPLVQVPVATALIRHMVATHSEVLVLALEGDGVVMYLALKIMVSTTVWLFFIVKISKTSI